jgi:hypothetical protein
MKSFIALILAVLPCAAVCQDKPLPKVYVSQQVLSDKEARLREEDNEKKCADKISLALQNLVDKDDVMKDLLKQAGKLNSKSRPAQYDLLAARVKVQGDDWAALSVDLREAIKVLPSAPGEALSARIRTSRVYSEKAKHDALKFKAAVSALAKPSPAKAPAGTDRKASEAAHRLVSSKKLAAAADTLVRMAGQLAAAGKFLAVAGK